MPGNLPDLAALHAEGVFGFKCFLLPSGVEEFPSSTTPGSPPRCVSAPASTR